MKVKLLKTIVKLKDMKALKISSVALLVLVLGIAGAQAQVLKPENVRQPINNDGSVISRDGIAKLYVQADNLARRGQYEQAMMLYNEALTWDPYDVETLMRRGELKYRIGQFREAQQDFQTANRINPYLADLFGYKGQMDKLALLAFEPDNYLGTVDADSDGQQLATLLNSSITKKMRGDVLGAMTDIQDAIDLGASDEHMASLYKIRGNLYLLLGNYMAAENDYTRALGLDPNFAEAMHNRGIARLLSNDRPSACWDFEESIRLGYADAEDPLRYVCTK